VPALTPIDDSLLAGAIAFAGDGGCGKGRGARNQDCSKKQNKNTHLKYPVGKKPRLILLTDILA
jgi:hypothetical protein